MTRSTSRVTSEVGYTQARIHRSETAHTGPAPADADTPAEPPEAPTQAAHSPAADISRTSKRASSLEE